MHRIMVAGSGTDVGKTVVSAILAILFDADYWKPIQCGDEEHSDSIIIKKWIGSTGRSIYSPAYSLKAPVSPHHAARLESISIELDSIAIPQTTRSLIIEGVGGVLVPLTTSVLSIDVFKSWDCKWVIVSKHDLGSINHTLLTIEALKQRQIPIAGLVFNGEPNPDSETAILKVSQLPYLGRLLPEKKLNLMIIHRYATEWKQNFSNIFH